MFTLRDSHQPCADDLNDQMRQAVRPSAAKGSKNPGFVGDLKVDETEKRARKFRIRRPRWIVSLGVPDCRRAAAGERPAELIVELRIGKREIARPAQQFGESLGLGRGDRHITTRGPCGRPHMLPTDRDGMHPREEGSPTGSANSGGRENVGIASALFRQPVKIGSRRH